MKIKKEDKVQEVEEAPEAEEPEEVVIDKKKYQLKIKKLNKNDIKFYSIIN